MKSEKKMSLTIKILLGLALGIIFGIIANITFEKSLNESIIKWVLGPAGTVFLRGIKMLVVPLVLCSLISGTASVGDIKKLGRVGIKTLVYYTLTTAIAITLAIVLASVIKPGVGGTELLSSVGDFKAAEAPFIMDVFVNMVPTNPIKSLVEGEMLQIITFSILFGIAATMIGKAAEPVINIVKQTNEVLLKIIGIVMAFAPVGVFALISKVIMIQGADVLLKLLKYGVTIILVLAIQAIIVYGLALKVLGRVNPIKFFKKFWPVMVVAFSTSSSNATIPVNLETCEEKLGVPNSIASFTIPLGATINMDGTAIMQGVATVFIAQVYGLPLTINQLMMVVLTATLASVGTAGVPGVGLITLSMVLQQVGLPVEGITLVLGIDRILDMIRTAVNVTGDAAATVIMANSESELDLDIYNSNNTATDIEIEECVLELEEA
ncbi:dicarboxylate/amino acid:cation symporter [Clostridium ganghwense]|uniref:Dicarboxylate/amino acid:cation symporter n=1 Tax=Clostridium ganghwense TaxID=312089 RepID=A0ABT4CKZ8_9CLOT|nr:dicarboxylate/amino acid:cation symporter [Clostridium ganghwense]MCY6369698.1 dicarboxylate/amino acid:cation symporter [Clostridium ganghwense]